MSVNHRKCTHAPTDTGMQLVGGVIGVKDAKMGGKYINMMM